MLRIILKEMKDGMQVLECLPICMKSLNSIPSALGWCTPVISVFGRQKKEVQKFKTT